MEFLLAKWDCFMFVWQVTSIIKTKFIDIHAWSMVVVWAEGHGTVHWWLKLFHACTHENVCVELIPCLHRNTHRQYLLIWKNESIVLNMDRHLACMYCYIDWLGVFNRVERSLALLQCMYVFVNPTVVFIFCSHVKLCVAGYLAFSMCGHIWRHADVQSWDCQQWVEDNRWRISWILALCICPHCE